MSRDRTAARAASRALSGCRRSRNTACVASATEGMAGTARWYRSSRSAHSAARFCATNETHTHSTNAGRSEAVTSSPARPTTVLWSPASAASQTSVTATAERLAEMPFQTMTPRNKANTGKRMARRLMAQSESKPHRQTVAESGCGKRATS